MRIHKKVTVVVIDDREIEQRLEKTFRVQFVIKTAWQQQVGDGGKQMVHLNSLSCESEKRLRAVIHHIQEWDKPDEWVCLLHPDLECAIEAYVAEGPKKAIGS